MQVSWRPDFPVPIINSEDNSLDYVPPICLFDMSLCYQFSGIPIDRLLQLDIYEYRIILINAITVEANKTEEGKQMLRQFKNISKHNTEFDTSGIMSIL